MDDLLQWASSEGCKLPLLRVVGRQLVAAADVACGSCILSVPQHLLLHEGHAWEHPTHGQAFRQLKEEIKAALDRRWMLCLLIILERARCTASKWYPYITILPKRYEDPLWWTKEELELLRGTRPGATVAIYDSGIQSLRTWRARLCSIQRELGGTNTIGESPWAMSDEALAWAKSTVWSRAFNIKCLGGVGKEGIALVPVLDMLDHSPAAHVAWHTGPEGADNFHFIAHSGAKQGEVVYTNYGYKSNEELIAGYGFVLDPNPADFLHVSMALGVPGLGSGGAAEEGSPGDAERVARLRSLLHRLGLPTTHYLTRAQPLPPALVAAAAICLLPDQRAYALLARAAPDIAGKEAWPVPAAAAHHQAEAQGRDQPEKSTQPVLDAVPGTVEVRAAPASAAAAPAGSAAGVGVPAGGAPVPLDLPLATRLGALRALRAQLGRKVGEMGGGPHAEDDLALLRAAAPGTPAHMALVYRATQKEIAEAALDGVAREAGALLREASGVSAPEPAHPGAPQSQDSRQHTGQSQDGCRRNDGNLALWLRQLGGSCSGLAQRKVKASTKPWEWGLEVIEDVLPGQKLACIPLTAGCAGASEEELAVQLAVDYIACSGGGSTLHHETLLTIDSSAGLGPVLDPLRHNDPPNAEVVMSNIDDLEGTPVASVLIEEHSHSAARVAALSLPLQAALRAKHLWAPSAEKSEHPTDSCLVPGVPVAHAKRALEWALAVVERCAVPGPSGGSDLAVLPFTCALPKELLGLVMDISWEQRGGRTAAILTAAAPLARGTLLCPALWLEGLPWERLLTQWGLRHLDGTEADKDESSGGWGRHASCAYELCLEPPDEHPCADQCRALLAASAIGTTHWLTCSTSQGHVLAAIALCAAQPQDLDSMGASKLQQLFSSSTLQSAEATTTVAPSVSAVGGPGVSPEELTAELAKAQQEFMSALLGNKRLMRTARQTLAFLLQNARAELQETQAQPVKSPGVRLYHTANLNIVQHHLLVLADRKRERTQKAQGKSKKRR